jgi:hypothetical protein
MTEADSVHSTPPTNTSVTRRSVLGTAAGAAAALAATGASPMAAAPAPDPVYAAIEAHRKAESFNEAERRLPLKSKRSISVSCTDLRFSEPAFSFRHLEILLSVQCRNEKRNVGMGIDNLGWRPDF